MFVGELQQNQKFLFEASMNGPTPDVPIQDIFALYRRTKMLLGMYKAFVPEWADAFCQSRCSDPHLQGSNHLRLGEFL